MNFYDCYLYTYTMILVGGTVDSATFLRWDTNQRFASALGATDAKSDRDSVRGSLRSYLQVEAEMKTATRTERRTEGQPPPTTGA